MYVNPLTPYIVYRVQNWVKNPVVKNIAKTNPLTPYVVNQAKKVVDNNAVTKPKSVNPNSQGKPDLVCNARFNPRNNSLELNSFERGYIGSNWRTIHSDGSAVNGSNFEVGARCYPPGTFSNVFKKAINKFYTDGELSKDYALELEEEARVATTQARETGKEFVFTL